MTILSRSGRLSALLLIAALLGTLLVAVGTIPAHAATTRYEAEQATRTGGAVIATDHTGYSGTGFVGGYTDANKGTASTSFAVSTSAAGTHTLGLRYANGTGSTKTLSLVVDGATQQVSLPATSNWDTWTTASVGVNLAAGSHTIAYRFTTADSGNINIDAVDLTTPATSPGTGYGVGPVFEAETATLTGGATTGTDHPGYSGTGFVGGYTDGNRGAATTTFKVQVTAAGSKSLTFRYANGTGSTKTLTLVVDGASQGQISFPATANWDAWSTVTAMTTLTAANHDVALRFGTGDSGNINLDRLEVSAVTSPEPPQAAGPGEAESSSFSGGTSVARTTTGFAGSGYVQGFTTAGARVIRTLAMPSATTATVTVRFAATGAARTLDLLVNARREGSVTLTSGTGWRTVTATVPVRVGVNTVGLRAAASGADVLIDSIAVSGESALATRGATTPYRQYEAEAGATNGSVLAASRTYRTVQSESSGRRAVRLDATGEQVSITLTAPANGLTIRYSLPDNAAGTGQTAPIGVYAGSTKVTDLTLTSKFSWVYGGYPFTNVVSGGLAHRFYDETRVRIPAQPVGAVIKLQIDSAVVPYIDIDLLEAESVPAALTAPAGAVSIASHGATSGGGDDTAAITAAVAAARAAGAPVWIPSGTFDVNTAIQVQGVTVLGAGPWYSTVVGAGNAGGFYGTGGGVTIADLAIQGGATQREDSAGQAAIEGDFANETLVQNVSIQHTKVALWVRPGSRDVLAVGLRVRDTYADGVNFRDGVRNSRVIQSTFRNTGDDGLAMWSDGSAVQDSVFASNTVQAPALSNGIAVYGGGGGNRVEDNLVADTVEAAAGIAVSTRFGVPFTGTTIVQRNTLTRTGSMETNWNTQLPGLWVYADVHAIDAPIVIRDNTIADSTFSGVLISWQKSIRQVSFQNVAITGSGTYGIETRASGSATFTGTTVSGSGTGGLLNEGGFVLNRVSGNSGF